MAAGTHALGLCGCEAGADPVDKKFDGEPMRQHDRFSAAIGVAGEQFERAAAFGVGLTGGLRHSRSSRRSRRRGASHLEGL
jgi:hypothetical protein